MYFKDFTDKIQHWHIISFFLMMYDIIASNGAYFLVLWLHYDFVFSKIPADMLSQWSFLLPFYSVAIILIFSFFKLYKSLWRFASYDELLRVVCASLISSIVFSLMHLFINSDMPIAFYIVGSLIQFLLVLFVRFSYRFVLLERSKRDAVRTGIEQLNIMIIGAGNAGQSLLHDIISSGKYNYRPCCIIDDNPNKWGRYIDGVVIEGGRMQIVEAVEKFNIDKIFLAIPSASTKNVSEILNICKETGCELKSLPSLYQIVNGDITVSAMKDVDVVDLLGRDPIKVNMDEIYSFIEGKTILVTGGGGSIGSELCRQIASHNPKQLIIFDIYENNAHAIQLELEEKYPDLDLHVLIGSVRDSERLKHVFSTYRPEVVYHAAAHKHVPLMEYSPCEAIKNNAIGTYKTAYAALMYGCERFVLISTDKAVNPTNIMGASKRLCEMVIQSFDRKIKQGKVSDLVDLHIRLKDDSPASFPENFDAKTEFVAVRFGNVLGSNGSVIPTFKEQIKNGGPVTVTHPDIVRYFMTIPEAVSLVLQAGTYAQGGEIFVLDMGEPVKIVDLACNLIKLSGLKPGEDIQIVFSGLRPGEKLYEEKLMAEEGIQKTDNDLIYIGQPIDFSTDDFLCSLESLMHAAYSERSEDIRTLVKSIVPTYLANDN